LNFANKKQGRAFLSCYIMTFSSLDLFHEC
jgi:hypothetical protein